jgi:hypothetical protein
MSTENDNGDKLNSPSDSPRWYEALMQELNDSEETKFTNRGKPISQLTRANSRIEFSDWLDQEFGLRANDLLRDCMEVDLSNKSSIAAFSLRYGISPSDIGDFTKTFYEILVQRAETNGYSLDLNHFRIEPLGGD